jgi:hypothetical protein
MLSPILEAALQALVLIPVGEHPISTLTRRLVVARLLPIDVAVPAFRVSH